MSQHNTDPRFIKKWVGYLHDVDRQMSIIAAGKLGSTKDPNVIPELTKALVKRPDDVRIAAARALGDIGHPSAVPWLKKLLKERNSILASTAAESLGKIGDSSAVPALIEVLESYKSAKSRHDQLHGFDRGVFTEAIYALKKINTVPARQAIAKYHR